MITRCFWMKISHLHNCIPSNLFYFIFPIIWKMHILLYFFYYLLYIFTKPIEFQKYALGPPSFLFRDLKGRTYIDCHSSNSYGTHRSLIREITALIFHSLRGLVWMCSVQFSSIAQSCPTLGDPVNRSTPGPPVHHQLRASMV